MYIIAQLDHGCQIGKKQSVSDVKQNPRSRFVDCDDFFTRCAGFLHLALNILTDVHSNDTITLIEYTGLQINFKVLIPAFSAVRRILCYNVYTINILKEVVLVKKGIQMFASWCLCIAIYLSCFVTYAGAYGDFRYVQVTPVEQAKDNWCWAACAEMCGKTVARESTRTQYDIVAHLYGSSSYDGPSGNVFNIIDGCNYAAMNKKSFKLEELKSEILVNWAYKNEAVVVLCYDKSDTSAAGHTLLINGTYFYDGDAGSWLKVYYIDPAYGREFNCLYDDFCDGSGNGGWLAKFVVHSV